MEQALAVIVGLVVGIALALAVALPLRRRRRRSGLADDRARRLPLHSAADRERAATVAAVFAGAATLAVIARQPAWAAILTIGIVVLATQSAVAVVAERLGRRRPSSR